MKEFLRRLLSVLLIQGLLLSPLPVFAFDGPNEVGPSGSGLSSTLLVSAPVTPEGGGELKSGLLLVSVPSGAVDETVMISVIGLWETSRMEGGRKNVTAGASAYRFLPAGL